MTVQKKTPADIDVVIAWVDGNDPKHQAKMKPYLDPQSAKSDDIAGPTRFRSEGEIFYCVASILRFAPFVRKIFIVTDEQNPHLEEFVQKNFPDNRTPIEIVDHKILFRGYEQYLPVFSNRPLETLFYRIPDLSENYVYFNDDFFLIRPLEKIDWFVEDKIVAYGYWRSLVLDRLLWLIKPMKNGHKPVGFKDGMVMAARKYGKRWRYFHLDHAPHPLKKSVMADYYAKNPSMLLSNISYKFRSGKQFNPQELYYLCMFDADRVIVRPALDYLLYMKPVNRGKGYIPRKLKKYEENPNLKFCCIGSLDLATDDDRNTLLNWLKNLLDIEL